MEFARFFTLTEHGGDVFVGTGPLYEWGGLYGGHIVAQALRAAALTTPDGLVPHSVRAYFIRRGDHSEPVRYEVDRIRNGRSFCTRRVVARQAVGAILNLEASFQVPEDGPDVSPTRMPADVPGPMDGHDDTWTSAFQRRELPALRTEDGLIHSRVWMKADDTLGADELLNRCALAYISDDIPVDSVRRVHPEFASDEIDFSRFFSASLDHAIWFHRPVAANEWHLYDVACHAFTHGRGLSVGHVFHHDGTHVATVLQEALVRAVRDREGA